MQTNTIMFQWIRAHQHLCTARMPAPAAAASLFSSSSRRTVPVQRCQPNDPCSQNPAGQQERLVSSCAAQTLQSQAVTLAAAAFAVGAASPAAAKTVQVDVPDDLFDIFSDPLGALLHSPVFAIGLGVTAMLLFPKLIRLG